MRAGLRSLSRPVPRPIVPRNVPPSSPSKGRSFPPNTASRTILCYGTRRRRGAWSAAYWRVWDSTLSRCDPPPAVLELALGGFHRDDEQANPPSSAALGAHHP